MTKTFLQLIRRDLVIFRRVLRSRYIDTLTMFTTNIIVFGYIMPLLGVRGNYGIFIMISAVAAFGLFDVVNQATQLIADICGDRRISYNLTLPVSSNLAFASIGVAWGISSGIIAICILPVGLICVWNQFSYESFSFIKFIPMLIASNLFYGAFALTVTSLVRGMDVIAIVWCRIITPLWMFSGYFYAWKSVYNASHPLGILNLFNPFIYVMEGMRAAFLGPVEYIPFWISFLAVIASTLILGSFGIYRLKRRLDCI